MNLPTSPDDLSRDPAAIQAELDRLEKQDTELQAALRGAVEQATRAGQIIRHMRNFVRRGEHVLARGSVNEIARETHRHARRDG